MNASEQIVAAARDNGWEVIDRPDINARTFRNKRAVIATTYDRNDHVRWCYLHCNGWPPKRVKGGTEGVILHLELYGGEPK